MHVYGARGSPNAVVDAFAVLWQRHLLLFRHHQRALCRHRLQSPRKAGDLSSREHSRRAAAPHNSAGTSRTEYYRSW